MVGRFRSPGCCIYVRRGDHGSPGRERACGGIPPRFLALWDPRPGRDAATPSYCVLMWRAGSIAFLLVPLVGAFVGYVILESPWVDAAVVILDLFAEFRSGLPAGLRPGVVQSRRRRYFSVRHWPLCRARRGPMPQGDNSCEIASIRTSSGDRAHRCRRRSRPVVTHDAGVVRRVDEVPAGR